MKKLILLTIVLTSSLSHALVVKTDDFAQKCTLYRATSEQTPVAEDDVIVSDKDAYGLTFSDMDIDFKSKKVTIQPMINVVLGFNRNLTNDRAFISSKNPEFKFLINQLNRKLYVFEKICISDKNEIIYAKQFETQAQK